MDGYVYGWGKLGHPSVHFAVRSNWLLATTAQLDSDYSGSAGAIINFWLFLSFRGQFTIC